jgi:cell division transport system permease protein
MTLFKRILAAGLTGFYRNRTVSLSSIFILTITLSLVASLFLFNSVFNYSVDQIKSKVDISIYFKPDAEESDITTVKNTIQKLAEVEKVIYTSKEEVLNDFKTKHQNDQVTMEALNELNSNPFGATLSVKARDTDPYDDIINKINSNNLLGNASSSVDSINYSDIKTSIDRLTNIVDWLSNIGFILTVIFMLMSVMIVYNTVRLAIFVFRDEISVMKLVGASNFYIRGPFIVESAIYGLIASLITVILCYPATLWISEKTTVFFEGFNIFAYYKDNVFSLFFILLLCGITVSCISSALAVRKYLKV